MTPAMADDPGTCWECGGPCLTHKGTVHGWRCTTCLNRYLADGAAKGAERDRKERERLERRQFRQENRATAIAGHG